MCVRAHICICVCARAHARICACADRHTHAGNAKLLPAREYARCGLSLRVFLPGAPRTFMSRIAFQHSCTMSEGAWADVSGIDGAGPFSEARTHEAPRRAVTHLAVFDGHVLKDEGQLELIQQQQAPPLIPGHPRTRTRQHSRAVRDMLPRAHARRPPLALLAVPPPPPARAACSTVGGEGCRGTSTAAPWRPLCTRLVVRMHGPRTQAPVGARAPRGPSLDRLERRRRHGCLRAKTRFTNLHRGIRAGSRGRA